MDKAFTSRAAFVGYLTLTAPAIAVIFLVPFFALRTFGPFLLVYYLIAGIALAWQWYSIALPSWKKWLIGNGAPEEEVDALARRRGFAWPVKAAIGPFALHTAAAALCGLHLGPWLVGRWYAWILPLTGRPNPIVTGNEYLQNFELANILPAVVVGYLLSRHFRRFATYGWVLPTVVLCYKLLTFTELETSVLAPHSSTLLSYFFVIQRRVPTFTPGFGGVDPIRVAEQMTVVAPFYAGLAYTVGALAGTRNLLDRFFRRSPMQAEPEGLETEEYSEQPKESEKPVHELN